MFIDNRKIEGQQQENLNTQWNEVPKEGGERKFSPFHRKGRQKVPLQTKDKRLRKHTGTPVPQTRAHAQFIFVAKTKGAVTHMPSLKSSCLILLMKKTFPDVIIITTMVKESLLFWTPIQASCAFNLVSFRSLRETEICLIYFCLPVTFHRVGAIIIAE